MGAFKYQKEFLFKLLQQLVFPFLASRYESFDVEIYPSLLILTPTLSWSSGKDKEISRWQVNAIQKWIDCLLEKPIEELKKYCLSLLSRLEKDQFFKVHKEHYKKMVNYVQKKRVYQK